MKIQSTSKVDKFSFDETLNRSINKSHVNTLAERILKNGQLVPIQVTSDYVVLDGQHRLEAIRQLRKAGHDIRVIYSVNPDMDMSAVAEMNGYQLKWTLNNWIDYYAKQGNENYIFLLKAREEYPSLTLSGMIPWLSATGNPVHSSVIRNGDFKIGVSPTSTYVLSNIQTLSIYNSCFTKKSFAVALLLLNRIEGFDNKRMFQKLHANLGSVIPQSGTGNWIHHLAYWYNKGLRIGRLNIDDLPRHH